MPTTTAIRPPLRCNYYTSSLCTPLSEVKSHIFGTLTLIGLIKVIVQGKYGLEYKDGELKTAIVSELSNSNISLQLCGDGMIGCDGEES
ncbi:MAG: hypothetical protein IRD7MM_02950 [Candidatus Midichloria mitochondrii]|uniref:hypothetical protein n=1 Tax=Candidatus Midichloria mitochondrii TaxID=234827 RepID=UPI00135F15B3|nr:hypothetical protein [Candidatus Midichloria mitochondrii]MDJ1287840.1 hypothetical protein [Candidatus Midichloria mitochondrii]MDJ1312880.1 hypothetical protein [Candidatus Midichloria mitochondrii]MDJ1583447.1 hypothetical protein [Candidatus Midichloria mitochondrii]